jgi:cyclopropane-fatty-acyl-phospholipid synthase
MEANTATRLRLRAPSSIEQPASVRAVAAAQRIVEELFGVPSERFFTVRYWNGAEERAEAGCASRFTLVLRWPGALRRMLLPPTETRLAEAFLRNDFDVDGDLEAAAALATPLAERLRSLPRLLRLARLVMQLPRGDDSGANGSAPDGTRRPRQGWRRLGAGRAHTRARDAQAIKHHYDVGNDFYSLWLDDHHAYSCAYFPTGNEDLTAAQEAKFDLICRKLRLQPGERLLDIGCGWGGLIRHAVRQYGVTALGITLSESQAALARDRIARDGLSDRCAVEVRDYRDLPSEVMFDKIASVGMFEHVGRAQLETYFATANRLTRPGGLFLNHGIISLDDARAKHGEAAPPRRLWGMGRFIDRYVFPDGELVPLATVVAAGEATGFETRDVENLREHYAETLRHWVRRLEWRSTEARALVGEKTFRVWRLYMAASAHAFRTARIGVVQVLLARPTADGACCHPRTRADLYV